MSGPPVDIDEDDEEVREIVTQCRFKLTTEFKFTHDGDSINATFIELNAPTSKQSRECAQLKQAFFRAMKEQADAADDDKDSEKPDTLNIGAEDVISLIAVAKGVDLADVIDIGKRLLLAPGIAFVDGSEKLKTTTLERMSVDDAENMIGTYLVNFVLASSLDRMKKTLLSSSQT